MEFDLSKSLLLHIHLTEKNDHLIASINNIEENNL